MGQWSHLYNNRRWRKLRVQQLADFPLCAYHMERGEVVTATVCDHVEPHKGDEVKFWSGPFQSLCKPCHDSDKQREELGTLRLGCDADGIPIDRRHHWQK